MDVDELRQREVHGASFDLLFFLSHRPLPNGKIGTSCLSQWWAAPFEFDGGHIGIYVSRGAQELLPRTIAQWLQAR